MFCEKIKQTFHYKITIDHFEDEVAIYFQSLQMEFSIHESYHICSKNNWLILKNDKNHYKKNNTRDHQWMRKFQIFRKSNNDTLNGVFVNFTFTNSNLKWSHARIIVKTAQREIVAQLYNVMIFRFSKQKKVKFLD